MACTCGEKDRYEGNEVTDFKRKLTEIQVDAPRWRILWKCESCGEYWEETYPQSELQGGGPPLLTRITPEYVAREWKLDD